MPRITRVYTRTGDDGSTALGTGRRVSKDALRIAAYGTVDELNSCIGVALAGGLCNELEASLEAVQNELFHLGSDLCVPDENKAEMPVPQIEVRHVESLERLMDEMMEALPALENFVLPGGSPGAAQLHLARTVCRRAERLVVTLAREESVSDELLRYLNRLSDALFVMARYENQRRGIPDVIWNSRA